MEDKTRAIADTNRVYGAPRRFSLATILTVTTAFACLFGGLTALGTQPAGVLGIGVFVASVGVGQALLFKGRRPRRASLLTGTLLTIVIDNWQAVFHWNRRFFDPCSWIVFGPILGYLAGVLVAGVFL